MEHIMEATQFWKNFNLGNELRVSGTFIYDGIRGFHEMKTLNYGEEAFRVLYDFSVGLERLFKIAVVLFEHNDQIDQAALEQSLKTHNLRTLLDRIRPHASLKLNEAHHDLLNLLTNFYKSTRYDRYSLSSVDNLDAELLAIRDYLEKHLNAKIETWSDFIAIENKPSYKIFIRKTVLKLSSQIFSIIRNKARSLALFTDEVRYGSKAFTVFIGEFDPNTEDVLWKELLIFMMNTKNSSSYLDFLKGIEALEFDPALIGDYLACFESDSSKALVTDELEHLYQEMGATERKLRLEMMSIIGASNVFFDDSDDEDSDTDEV